MEGILSKDETPLPGSQEFCLAGLQMQDLLISVYRYSTARGLPGYAAAHAEAVRQGLAVPKGTRVMVSVSRAQVLHPELPGLLLNMEDCYPSQEVQQVTTAHVLRSPQEFGFAGRQQAAYALQHGSYQVKTVGPRLLIGLRQLLPPAGDAVHNWRLWGEVDGFLLRDALGRLDDTQRRQVLGDDEFALDTSVFHLTQMLMYLEELRTARRRAEACLNEDGLKAVMAQYSGYYDSVRWVINERDRWRHPMLTQHLPATHVLSIHDHASVRDFTR